MSTMPPDGPRGGPKSIDWALVREDYETRGITNVTQLSKRHGVSREGVSRKKSDDAKAGRPWIKPDLPISPPKSDNVIDLGEHVGRSLALLQGGAGREREPGIPGDEYVNDPAMHDRIGGLLLLAVEKTLQEYNNGQIQPGMNQSKADVLNAIVTGSKNGVALSRTIAGIASGDASTADHTKQTGLTIRRQILEPEKIPVDEKGRKISA